MNQQPNPESPPNPAPEEPSEPSAWQPFTPRGLSAFAKASFARTLLLLWVVALIASGTIVWFLNAAWFPTIRAAIKELPEQGLIVNGKLEAIPRSSEPLAEQHFLGFTMRSLDAPVTDLTSHIVVKFRNENCEICSIFGCSRLAYPRSFPFNRLEMQARWGAWEPILDGGVAILSFLALVAVWAILAFVASFVVWPIAWFKKKQLSWSGSWQVSAAALMPGALLFTAAIWAYSFELIALLQFLVTAVLQFVIGAVYLACTIPALPVRPPRVGQPTNPFSSEAEASAAAEAHGSQPPA